MPREDVEINQEVKAEPEFITIEIEPEPYSETLAFNRVKEEPQSEEDDSNEDEEDEQTEQLPATVSEQGYITVEVEHLTEEQKKTSGSGSKSSKKQKQEARYEKYVKVVEGSRYKKYACQLCDYQAARWATHRHVKNHVHRLTCSICEKFFPESNLLENHIAELHPELKKSKLRCEPCDIEFTTTKKLEWHRKYIHSRLKCSLCSEMITRKTLIRHLRQFHENNLPSCEECGFRSTSKSKVNRHRKLVHFKEKHVTCDICNFQCFDVLDLRRHMVSHDSQKLYACQYCNKRFARKNNCALHEKIHTGEKNKVCSVCGAAFVQKASLNYHMTKHHSDG